MKKNKLFRRTLKISFLVIFCIFLGVFGVIKAYKGIRLVSYGEYDCAITVTREEIKILDYKININKLF